MKKDLTHLIRREEAVPGFEDIASAKEYVARYLLNYINIELEGLPKEEWDRTLETWAKMCAFARGLIGKGEKERSELYKRFRFDMMMQGIMEDLRNTFIGMLRLGILKENDPPHLLLLKAVELVREDRELQRRWELNPETVDYLYRFYTRMVRK